MENRIQSILCELGICREDSIIAYHPKVRDRDDVAVKKCLHSGVIFLSRSDHMDIRHYQEKRGLRSWGAQDRKEAVLSSFEDNQRRFEQFQNVVCNKRWLDVGSRSGGILDLLSPIASATFAVEPQEQARESLIECGYKVYPSVKDVPSRTVEVVTLFHVLEHFTEPIETLREIKNTMVDGARFIVEVPHANDFLISFLDLDAFKSSTFWSEHLILHTRESLRVFLEAAGFRNICIRGYQRYPLSNHLHWLSEGKPGGHLHWECLNTPALESAYADMLAKLDKTDTLIATAEC